jgi:glycosyltransferase involved in cell wall biosynthesis
MAGGGSKRQGHVSGGQAPGIGAHFVSRVAGKQAMGLEGGPSVTYISWAPHCSRSDYTARELGGTSHMVYWGWLGSHPATVWLKYLGQTLSTWRVLLRERPDIVFVMSPPPLAILAVYAYCVASRSRYVVDAHTGVFLTRRWRLFQGMQFWLCRRAITTIVTNDHIAALVNSRGGSATVVADVPIQFEAAGARSEPADFVVVFVTSFDRDEPIEAMVEAARRLAGIPFLMTGDWRSGAQQVPAELPPNLRLTGFLDPAAYGRLLSAAGVVVALTTDEHTMQRGAYEAIYHGTPVIVSETRVLLQAFDEGALHVDNSPGAIADAVLSVRDNVSIFRESASRLRARKTEQWLRTKANLWATLCRHDTAGA